MTPNDIKDLKDFNDLDIIVKSGGGELLSAPPINMGYNFIQSTLTFTAFAPGTFTM